MLKPLCRIALCCVVCLGFVGGTVAQENNVLMVVPARMRILKVAFDMEWLRPVSLVSYQGAKESGQPLLHLWTGSEWRHVSNADFKSGRFLGSAPGSVVLVGDDEMLPAVLVDNVAWCRSVTRIETIDVADLINRLDLVLEFTEDEWKWLARRYKLVLTDIYEDRRTINPYTIRRSELPVEISSQAESAGGIAPAVLMEERKVEGIVLIEEISAEP